MEPRQELAAAWREGRMERLEALLDAHPEMVHEPGLITKAAGRGDAAMVRLLLTRGASPDDTINPEAHSPLFSAVFVRGQRSDGLLEVVRLLAGAGVPLDFQTKYQHFDVLKVAAALGYEAMAELLLELGAPLDAAAAAMLGMPEALARLLDEDPSRLTAIDVAGRQPLHCLGMSRMWEAGEHRQAGMLEAARVLVERGAELETPTAKDGPPEKFRPRPLWWAVSLGRCEALVRWLLQAGASPATGLAAAAYQNHRGMMAALLEAGADINERSNKGGTPLHDCLLFARPGAVLWLLERGADVSARTPEGLTPLHLAAVTNQAPELLRALLEAGADPLATDEAGRTPADLARQRNHDAVLAVLSP